jgi:glycosyltransferase involved in cell wall biosynthesis
LFSPEKRDPNLAVQLGFKPKAPLVISLRSLEALYDIPTFVRAVPLVKKNHPDTGFIIVGSGPERESLGKLIRELNVESAVKFSGRLSDDDMVRYTASVMSMYPRQHLTPVSR